MLVPVVLGAVAGLGLWCVVMAFTPRPERLGPALGRLADRRTSTRDTGPGSELDSLAHRLAARVMAVVGTDLRSLTTDLAVLERSEETHLIQRVKTGAFYAGLPPLVGLMTWIGGVTLFSPLVLVAASLILAGAGWILTDAQVRTGAVRRRAEFDGALVTYVSLVSILLAGGAGIQEALHEAVDQGRGWAFGVLRRALIDSRVRGVSPWTTFDEYGTDLGLRTLIDLAATMDLAGSSGAQVRDSLMTKAQAMRTHEIAAIERQATSRTSAMVGPTGLMMTGFVILVIYPAFRAVLDI